MNIQNDNVQSLGKNIRQQMRKGYLEYCILLLIHREETYAPDIIRDLKAAKMIVMEGTLYPLLTRLKNSGMLSYKWEESPQGPPRKYYRLTDKGEQLLDELRTEWRDMQNVINNLSTL